MTVIAFMLLVPSGRVMAQEDRFALVLNVLRGYYYREITPGEESTIYLEIRNNGKQAVTDIRLISDNPKGWAVGLSPGSIDYLNAGNSQSINMSVTAPTGTGRGEYTLTIIAEASQARTATSTVVQVERAYSLWLWIGVGLVALVIAAFVIVFLRFGRE
ncbi:NEW3 domain-containing protein [Chloroflexota bacterium]